MVGWGEGGRESRKEMRNKQSNQCFALRKLSADQKINTGFAHKCQRRRRMITLVEHPGHELFESASPEQRNATHALTLLRLPQVGREAPRSLRGTGGVKEGLVRSGPPQVEPLWGLGKGSNGTGGFASETSLKMRGVWLQRHRLRSTRRSSASGNLN